LIALRPSQLQILTFGQRCSQGRKHGDAADYLLLQSQMIMKQLVSSNVAGVHAGHGVVHQKLGINLRGSRCCRFGSEGLTKIIATF
jgi:hypothetical protein